MSAADGDRPPDQLAGYRLGELLGSGNMGSVYRAERLADGEPVALKLLPREIAQQPALAARFEREGAITCKLDHPHLIRAYEAGIVDGWAYLALELVEGKTLAEHLEQRERLPESQALMIAGQLVGALEHLEQHNIVHRDIKPANVILTPAGQAKLLDLGLARAEDGADLTQPGMIIGTPDYMPPEQLVGQPLDGRADLYALGATLYALLTGRGPLEGRDSIGALLQGHNEALIPHPRALVPEISEPTGVVIERLLARSPEDRYPTARALGDDLTRIGEGGPLTTQQIAAEQTLVLPVSDLGLPRPRPRSRSISSRNRRGPRPRRQQVPWVLVICLGLTTLVALGMTLWLVQQKRGGPAASSSSASASSSSPVAAASSSPRSARPLPAPLETVTIPSWGLALTLPPGWTLDVGATAEACTLSGPDDSRLAIRRFPKPAELQPFPLEQVVALLAAGAPIGADRQSYSRGGLTVAFRDHGRALYRLAWRGLSADQVAAIDPDVTHDDAREDALSDDTLAPREPQQIGELLAWLPAGGETREPRGGAFVHWRRGGWRLVVAAGADGIRQASAGAPELAFGVGAPESELGGDLRVLHTSERRERELRQRFRVERPGHPAICVWSIHPEPPTPDDLDNRRLGEWVELWTVVSNARTFVPRWPETKLLAGIGQMSEFHVRAGNATYVRGTWIRSRQQNGLLDALVATKPGERQPTWSASVMRDPLTGRVKTATMGIGERATIYLANDEGFEIKVGDQAPRQLTCEPVRAVFKAGAVGFYASWLRWAGGDPPSSPPFRVLDLDAGEIRRVRLTFRQFSDHLRVYYRFDDDEHSDARYFTVVEDRLREGTHDVQRAFVGRALQIPRRPR